MSRLPQVNADKGNWGRILNTWLKHIAGYRGVAPARPASGNLPAGVAVNGTGYDTTDQFQSENSGLNFHDKFPDGVPTGFTFIHTLHNRIYRKEDNGWAVLLEGYTPQSGGYLVTNAENIPTNLDGTNSGWPFAQKVGTVLQFRKIVGENQNHGTLFGVRTDGDLIRVGLTGGNNGDIIWRNQNTGVYEWTNPSNIRSLLGLGTLTVGPLASSAGVIQVNPNTFNPAQTGNQNINIGFTGGSNGQFLTVNNGTYQWANIPDMTDADWLVAQNNQGAGGPGAFNQIPTNLNQWIYTNGRVGIITNNPLSVLHIVQAESPDLRGIVIDQYSDDRHSAQVNQRKARGTPNAPLPVLAEDILAGWWGRGYDGNNFSTGQAGMLMMAAEDWTPNAHGAGILFRTTAIGTTNPVERVRITDIGDVGIGTTTLLVV